MATKEQLADLMAKAEELAVNRERVRILEALEKNGPTGDFFEMRWEDLIKIIAP